MKNIFGIRHAGLNSLKMTSRFPCSFSGGHKRPVGYLAWISLLFLLIPLLLEAEVQAENQPFSPYGQRSPYVGPPYQAPPEQLNESRNRFLDNGDGTVTDQESGLFWSKADSYSALGKCLNWHEAKNYVSQLRLGGYEDWDLPTVQELLSIYDAFEDNVISFDHNPEYPLGLNKIFADGAAYLYWSKDTLDLDPSSCCAKSVYFVNGLVTLHRFEMCNKSGVRAVRRIKESRPE